MLPSGSNSVNNSVVKAFTLLEYFSNNKAQWGVRELARHIGAHESTTYRLMSTLESLGVLYKNPDNDKYALGLKLFELGNRVNVFDSMIQMSHPTLIKVAEEIEETVHLGLLKKGRVLMIDKVESEKGLKLHSDIGQISPAHCTGLGKVLLAHSKTGLHATSLKTKAVLESFTQYTITDPAKLELELDKIRAEGYAIDRQEYELGLICVAVPVFNKQQEVVAALSAAGPSVRFKPEELHNYVRILKDGASALSNKIGHLTTT